MEVHFTPEVEDRIQRVAAENRSTADDYIQQLVERHLDHDSWFRQQVQKGLDQLDRGEFLTHEEVGQRLEQMFRS
jgi:predicted transcriptional regulator